MKTLLIDDLRNLPADMIARTYKAGIDALRYCGPWDVLLLDHDLGEPDPKHTGYGIMCWLEENKEFVPGNIEFVTANPVGRKNMLAAYKKLYE